MAEMIKLIVSGYNFWVFIVLMMVGLYGIIAKHNLVKKIIGLGILQTAIILFYVSIAAKRGATIPIIEHGHDSHAHVVHAVNYINPLPHVLMLTAIVVSVATLGVALALAIKVHQHYHTLDENEILEQIRSRQRNE
jgi:multicomponent Na+:H+ antiporter subunit C